MKLLYQPTKSAGAGCKYSADYYRRNNAFFKQPIVGDQVFFGDFGNEGHTGIVVAVSGNVITTVEGNTSGGYGVDANGDGVYLKQYNFATTYIPGFGRANWSVVCGKTNAADKEETTVSYPMLKQGSTGEYVKKAQKLLIDKGYSCGAAGADGDFGEGTKRSVMSFQADNGIDTDGIVGAKTWAALLKEDKPTDNESVKEPGKAESTDAVCSVDLPVLKQGAKGFPVLAVQILMSKQNVSVKYTDGDFGPDTLAKVKEYQGKKGMTSDGIVGRDTWAKLLTNE